MEQEKQKKEIDRRKQSLYFPTEVLAEIRAEAERQDRSLSWVVQQAWKVAKPQIQQYPAPGAGAPAQNPLAVNVGEITEQ